MIDRSIQTLVSQQILELIDSCYLSIDCDLTSYCLLIEMSVNMINRSIQRLASVNDRSTVTWRATATDDIETQCSEWQQCTFAAVVASMRRTMSVCVQFVHCQTVGLIKLHWVYFAWHFFACCILLLLASFIAPSFHDCCALVLLRIHISFEELDMAPIASYLHMLLHVACTSNRMAKATSQVKNMLNMTFVEFTVNISLFIYHFTGCYVGDWYRSSTSMPNCSIKTCWDTVRQVVAAPEAWLGGDGGVNNDDNNK